MPCCKLKRFLAPELGRNKNSNDEMKISEHCSASRLTQGEIKWWVCAQLLLNEKEIHFNGKYEREGSIRKQSPLHFSFRKNCSSLCKVEFCKCMFQWIVSMLHSPTSELLQCTVCIAYYIFLWINTSVNSFFVRLFLSLNLKAVQTI